MYLFVIFRFGLGHAGGNAFEERYQFTSEAAWDKYGRGEFGDEIDTMEWMGLYENCLALEQQLKRIKNSRSYVEPDIPHVTL